MKWTPELIIALSLIIGCLCLISFGLNGEVKGILAIAAGWAFRSSLYRRRKRK